MLADEEDAITFVDRQDPDGPVREVDDAVDSGRAVGPDDLVVPHGQPGVLVGDPAIQALPRAGRRGGPPGLAAHRIPREILLPVSLL